MFAWRAFAKHFFPARYFPPALPPNIGAGRLEFTLPKALIQFAAPNHRTQFTLPKTVEQYTEPTP